MNCWFIIYLMFFLISFSTCEDHLSPSGTIERAREAVESASRSILASRAAAQKREDDSVFVESGKLIATNKGRAGKCKDFFIKFEFTIMNMNLISLRKIEIV